MFFFSFIVNLKHFHTLQSDTKSPSGECTCNATTFLNTLKRDIEFGESIRGTPGIPGKEGKTGAPGLTVSIKKINCE